MGDDSQPSDPFASLRDLRKAHEKLLKAQGATDRGSRSGQGVNIAMISDFIGRASATGAHLGISEDRRAAQGLIDYWVAASFSLPRERGGRLSRLRPASALLEEFTESVATRAAERGDAFIHKLQQENETETGLDILARLHAMLNYKQSDYDIVRRIMLALIRLPSNEGTATSAPAPRSALLALGEADHVKGMVQHLSDADVLDVDDTSEDPMVRLKYDSLIERWSWLSELIGERRLLREKALKWAQSGRKSSLLLKRRKTLAFRTYADLNELEQEYANVSGRFAKRNALLSLGALVLCLTFFLVIYYYEDLRNRYYLTPERVQRKLLAIVHDAQPGKKDSDIKEITQNIKWLSNNRRLINVNTATLKWMNLGNLFGPGADFTSAKLEVVGLNRATLRGSSFRKAKLSFVDLEGADLENAAFSGATIAGTKFNGANLVRANFDDVRFCGGVDFSNADVRYTSARNVSFPPDQAPTIDGIAWWLVDGWTSEQRRTFGATPHVRDKMLKSLEKELNESQEKLRQLEDTPFSRALWLNDNAWLLAIYGFERKDNTSDDFKIDKNNKDKASGDIKNTKDNTDGAKLARQAIEIFDDLLKVADGNRDFSFWRANTKDTLGYILLQKASDADARKDNQTKNRLLDEAIGLLAEAENADVDGGITLRRAVALNAAGREPEALVALAVALKVKGYTPTHELYLLARFINGQPGAFLTELEQYTGSTGAANTRPANPEQSNSGADPCSPR